MNYKYDDEDLDLRQGHKEQIISYQKLRTFIGLIGFFLPIILALGCLILGAGHFAWQPSISHYYYSKMHIIYVALMCMLGGFLVTYKGKPENMWESSISNFAGFLSLGVVSFPTSFCGFRTAPDRNNLYLQLVERVSNSALIIHIFCSAVLFICFIIFCFKFFRQPDKSYDGIELIKFNRRKRLYTICGWGITVSLLLMTANFIYEVVTHKVIWQYTTLLLETTGLQFFGVAWLVKGSELWRKYPAIYGAISYLR